MHLDAIQGLAEPLIARRWQSRLSLAVTVVCLAALEIYIGAGVVVVLLPLLAVPRLSLQVLLGFGIFVALKTMVGLYVDMGPGFAIYAFSSGAAGREYVALLTTALMFVAGYKVMTREAFERIGSGWLLLIPVINIIVHTVTRDDLLAATADNTQILSLYVMFVVVLRRGNNLWPLIAVLLALFMGAGLKNSFTTVATMVILICYVAKNVGLADRNGPFRPLVFVYIVVFMFLSLIAYLFVFRVVVAGAGEGNNGLTRALLAQFAYLTFFDHPITGTTIGLPAVPSDAIYLLNWTQYLTGDDGANVYGLSFHNSLLYMLTRLGAIGYVILGWLILRLVPREGKLLDIMFTAVPFLFLSANVVLESVRAGPGVALVLGSLFSVAARGYMRTYDDPDSIGEVAGWNGHRPERQAA
jgi:hypothetical protein